MTNMPDFESEKERQQWIINNADYFTVVRRRNLKNERLEFKSLSEAEAGARKLLVDNPDARYLIYAVAGIHDTFVKVIAKEPSQ